MTARTVSSGIVAAEFAAAAGSPESLPAPVQVEVAFVGRSNVGKSTLLNGLMRRKGLARISNTPGCTRTINFFDVRTQDGLSLKLVDLPGYGYAKRAKSERLSWAEMIEEYLLKRATLRLIVLLVDARRGLEEDERNVLELMATPSRVNRTQPKTLIVATKLDKLPSNAQKPALERLRAQGDAVMGSKPEP
ncbi:MAG TPA: ribosome biogenesis GTP-binding protein YihA/YsxC, partial [Polyangiaceae bacterium]|nr:ribosome biogenesis GTP-binding protein YihA/YsxC [Polyangiaceae bacterium]